MKKIPYVIFGGDALEDGSVGPETQSRCEYVLKSLNGYSHNFVIILAAGINPKKPGAPPLKNEMEAFIELNSFHNHLQTPEIILAERDCWRTFNEVLVIIEELKKLDVHTVYLSSSWYHIPRIWLIWSIVSDLKNKIIFKPIPTSLSIKKLLRELGAFLKVPIDLFKWKFKRPRH